jgi:two-component system, cell cycle sensor histidine kinase DivJ
VAFKLRHFMRAIESRLSGLVHPSVKADPDACALHQRILSLRVMTGLTVAALLPAFLAMSSGVDRPGLGLIAGLCAPLFAAMILSFTGSLAVAQFAVSAGLALAVAALAHMTGGIGSPLLILLVFIPLESQISRSRNAVMGAGIIAWTVIPGLWLLELFHKGAPPSPESVLNTLVSAVALFFSLMTTLMVMGQRSKLSQERRQMLVRSRLMLESVGDIVAWFDAGGRLAYANKAAGTVLHANVDHLRDHGFLARVHLADRPLFMKTISDVAHGGEPATISFRVSSMISINETRWLEMRLQRVASAVLGVDEVAVVAVIRDETERRQIEIEREKARLEAQRASEVKGRFLATVSHELRTPLNAIIGFSEMLATEGMVALGSAQQRDYAKIIQSSGAHLLEIVNALLDSSKIESGAMTIERDVVDMARLATECCDLLDMRCQNKSVRLERVIGEGLPQIMADRRAIKQVVINLLSNALKFTPENGRITLALVRDKDVLDISVSDTGIGIAAEDLPNVGMPFFQARSAYDRSHEGTGLGLSVVRGLVGLHGGEMSIESAAGEGTRVGIRLPISAEEGASIDAARIITLVRPPRRQLGFSPELTASDPSTTRLSA